MASVTSAMMTNNNNELYGQRQYQPGFDSVPDLIRYYVGGADDDAVLSYGGGNDGTVSNTVLPQLTRTDVRIRYPCNRHHSLTMSHKSGEVIPPVAVQEKTKHVEIIRQNSPATGSTVATLPASEFQTSADLINVPMEGFSTPQNPQNRRCTPSPPPYTPCWKDTSSGFRSIPRKTPSTTIASAGINLATSIRTSAAGSVNSSPPWSTSLPRPSTSTPDPSRIGPGSLASGFSSSSSLLGQSSTTLPRPLKSSSSHTSISKSPLPLGPSYIPSRPSSSSEVSTFTPVTSSLANEPPALQAELVSRQISPKKSYKKLDTSFETFGTPELSKTLSMSSICRPNLSESIGSGVIDIDIEIAATVEVDDSEYKFNCIPDTTVVQSSFARVNVNNIRRSRFRSRRSRSKSRQNSENRWSGLDSRQVSGLETLVDIVKDSRDREQLQQKQQLQKEQRPPTLSSNLNVETIKQRQHMGVEPEELDENCQSSCDDRPQLEPVVESNQVFKKMDPRNLKHVFKDSNGVEQLVEEGRNLTHLHKRNVEMQHFEISKLSDEERWADAEIERLVNEGLMNPDQDSDFENSLSEYEDFEAWRSKWADSIRCKFIETPELRRQLRHQRRRERLLRHQMRRLQECQEKTNSQSIETFTERMTTEFKRNLPVGETRRTASQTTQNICPVPAELQDLNTYPEARALGSSIRQSNNDLVNMIRRWIGIHHQHFVEQHSSGTSFGEVSGHVTSTTLYSTRNISGTTSQEMKVCSANSEKLIGDYENLRFSNENPDNHKHFDIPIDHSDKTIDQGSRRHYTGNNLSSSWINHKNYFCNINNYNNVENNMTAGVDYENVVACNTNDSGATDYENIGININEQCHRKNRLQLLYGNKGGGAAVAAALRAIHMTIIGDPEDVGGITSVAGTGRLAAALCRADGRVTVLPYNRVHQGEIKRRPLRPILKSCPLQLLGQPGPAGRRARLDVIERYLIFTRHTLLYV